MPINDNFDSNRKRLDEVTWKKANRFVTTPPKENNTNLPPEYGYVLDYLRNYYNIYISMIPQPNLELSKDPNMIFNWRGEVYVINTKNKITYRYTYSDTNYVLVIRNVISNSIDYLTEQNNSN